jgi:transposase
MNPPPGLAIPPEDWERTPLSVQAVVITLWQENQVLKQQVASLQQQVNVLRAEVEKLSEQLKKNSRNSSKPPSSDPPQKRTYPKPEPSGRKKGAQPGHPGKGRKLKPAMQVNRVVSSKPMACAACGALLLGEDPHPVRHQVSELPRIEPEVIEYQLHTLICCVCGAQNAAEWPAGMPKGSFGERLQATVGYLSGRFGISHRDIEEALETIFHVEISLGSIPAQEQRISQAVKQPVEEAQQYVQEQAVVNLDETSWQEWTQNFWLWVMTTPDVTVFRLFQTRGAAGAAELLGEGYGGIVGSDRYSAYNWLDPLKRQVCWAHLKRDFQALVERGGESKTIGRLLLAQVKQMFAGWQRVRDGTFTRADFQAAMQPIRKEVSALLHVGTFVKHVITRRTCRNILKVEPALWTFVDQEGVEPTNNAAERALRRGVIWRRRSFGTQSENGSRFVERILTVVTSLRQQKRDVLDYLTEACKARTRGSFPPSLLPTG